MAKTANQLSVARNEDVAETVAATIWDFVATAQPTTARDASAFRMVRKHVKELLELHDSLEPDKVLIDPPQPGSNGSTTYDDPSMLADFARTES